MIDRSAFLTEQRLTESSGLDTMSARQIVALMNAQDRVAIGAVAMAQAEVAKAVEIIVERFARGGRLIYVGAGSSGRLGVLDASECPPTFRSDPQQVIGIIAGGEQAMFRAQEGAEDSFDDGAKQIASRQVSEQDVVCGIAAGGTTPFVHGALAEAKSRGAATLFVTCVDPFEGEPQYDVTMRARVGPEVLTGSTRLKAGTATKLILNQLSTASMVRSGKCYQNLMVDVHASNAKLRDRATRLISTICGTAPDESANLLAAADQHVKVAIVMHKRRCDREQALAILEATCGSLRRAIEG
jgi:N-acetylmuramic acid 6-phosphate etherase